MRRAILPALLLMSCAVPSEAQYGLYGGYGDRDAQRTVRRWYERYLGREPDPYSGSWAAALQQGQSPEQVLSGILGSDEYYRRAGGTPRDFVRQLYEDLVGRPPTRAEMDSWARQVYYGNRADVAYSLLARHAQNWDPNAADWSDRYDYRRPYHRYR